MTLSLLDVADRAVFEWYVVYAPSIRNYWWVSPLKKGFRHVKLYRPVQYGPKLTDRFWLMVDPGIGHIDVQVLAESDQPWESEPVTAVQFVQATPVADKVREYFSLGALSCVEVVKAHLGIARRSVRTPWQLYKHIIEQKYILR